LARRSQAPSLSPVVESFEYRALHSSLQFKIPLEERKVLGNLVEKMEGLGLLQSSHNLRLWGWLA
jgi:hypothetical protein